jgi:hypothetical protein
MPRSNARRTSFAEEARAIAERLIEYLGEQATCHATFMAFKARKQGDRSRMDKWLWIADTTRQILRSEP